jgi:hypothetical protein
MMDNTETILDFYKNINTLSDNHIQILYVMSNKLFNNLCNSDDMKKVYEKIFQKYCPSTIYDIIIDPNLHKYKNTSNMLDAKKLLFISYCVLMFFEKTHNMEETFFLNI